MNTPTNDDILLDMIESITLDVLARIGDNADARYEFLKGFAALAWETSVGASTGRECTPNQTSGCRP